MRALAVALALGLCATAYADDAAAVRFDSAIALEGTGQITEAVDALEAFARELPDHTLAPDALGEAAALSEDRLHDPARALVSWRTLAEHYPQSRGARRANLRRAELERLFSGGADPQALGAYQRIIDEAGSPARVEARQAMRAFLAAHPGFPLTDAGLYWLGHTAEQRSLDDEALRDYEAAISIGGAAAPRAARARAELLLRLDRLTEASAALASLERFTDPVTVQARTAGLDALRAVRARARLAKIALAVFGLLVTLAFAVGRRDLWPPPIEARFFLPVALLFAAAAVSEHRAIAKAVVSIAAGATVALWAAGAARARATGPARRIGIALGAALAVVTVAYLAIYWSGLIDLVVETWRSGPDR